MVKKGSGKQQIATTMAFVRLLKDLMRDKEFGKRVVPIIPDEARTFGMDSFFPTIKIYNPHGQNYTSVDAELMLAYKEAKDGQILHLGINEAGSMAAFTAAGTSYATHGEPMVPIYVFYSMFGFQRTGDSIWAAADQMARGFLIGATAGRTTLTGEGLQHADGHSPLLAATNPAVVAYDPAYAYEIAHIVQDGLRRMYGDDPENVIYYLTVYNEPMQPAARARGRRPRGHPARHVPARARRPPRAWPTTPRGCSCSPPASACRGRSRRRSCCATTGASSPTSGRSPRGASCAATAWPRRAGVPAPRAGGPRALRHPAPAGRAAARSWRCPTTCARCRTRSGQWVPGDFASLGADGFGFSDTRPAARRFFHIDGPSVAVRALQMLAKRGEVDGSVAREAAERYRLLDVTAGTSGNAGGES